MIWALDLLTLRGPVSIHSGWDMGAMPKGERAALAIVMGRATDEKVR